MRFNPITLRWVIYAAARQQRPHDHRQRDDGSGPQPRHDTSCPFCPGNEHLTPPTILQWPAGDRPWRVRAFVNKFPILTPDDDTGIPPVSKAIYSSAVGYGRHEVVVETPDHHEDLARMPLQYVEVFIEVCHQRYVTMKSDPLIQCVFLFRNHGARAGASLSHPHSQLIGTHIVTPQVRFRESAARRYHRERGKCAWCEALGFERGSGQRLVYENPSFLAFVPYAAEVPCEIWVAPCEHRADFSTATGKERADLADALHTILRRLRERANDPDYNLMFHTASRSAVSAPYMHWYVQIRPRIGVKAGFEMASGMAVNTSLPEEDAARLRLGN